MKTIDNAHAHIERAKSHAVDKAYHLGRAVELQATVYYRQDRLLDARSEALRALEIYRKLGAVGDQERCEHLLHKIDVENSRSASGESDSGTILFPGAVRVIIVACGTFGGVRPVQRPH